MANVEIGTAYVGILPSMNGMEAAINKELGTVDTTKSGKDMGTKMGKGLSKSLKSSVTLGLKAAAAAATAALAGAVAVGQAALDAYAEYEQLVGGVDTLFKESSDALQEYAASAYKTAGMSANQYMDLSTSFAASLLQSLGGDTKEAVEYANMAITDMSDNANKMGTDMERITDAYQGFAKQNFTMLDNLKLGYGGTKEEMQRLLEDAEKLSGIEYDISSYSDIVDAIHVVQTEMGITGTTALEASQTISGSVQSAKAAWTNWLVGLADENANLAELTNTLVDSIVIAAQNIVPRIGQIMSALGPAVMDALRNLFAQMKASFSTDGASIGEAALSAFGTILTVLAEISAEALAALGLFLASVVVAIVEKGTEIFDKAVAWASEVMSEVGRGFSEGFDRIKESTSAWLDESWSKITSVWNDVTSFVSGIPSKIVGFFTSLPSQVASKFEEVKKAITDKLDAAKRAVSDAVKAIKDKFKFNWSLPKPKLPRFSVSGGKAPWGFMGQGSLPRVSISWYAQGGIIDAASIIGVGEAGPEAVVPLTPSRLKPFAQAVTAEMHATYDASGGVTAEDIAAAVAEAIENANIVANAYFGRKLVSEMAPDADRINGLRQMKAARGLAL